jgi:hypothetical protein
MTLQFKGGARVPGPLGISPEGVGGRAPGPIGVTLWQKQSTPPLPGTLAKVVKRTTMPPPTNDQDSRDVHVVTWPLFKSPKAGPAFNEVKQAPGIANCPVASMLAALAFTPVGQTVIQGMVSETAGNVLTDLSGLPSGTLSNPPPGTTISSSRYFSVKLAGGSIDVSDVLYTDDHDSGWSPIYIRDPSDQSIWAAIIEKALAVKLKSYENFDALNINANDFWEKITGVRPGQIEIKADTPLTTITAAAKASTRVPSIGASKPDAADVKFVTEFHGFAMLGLEGSKIKLYDPAKAVTLLISPADFRHDFLAILFRK